MTATVIAPTRQAVGIGQIVVTKAPDTVLVAYGLGSCVGIAIFDEATSTAGMAHVLLPLAEDQALDPSEPARYGDVAVNALLQAMTRAGAKTTRLIVKLAGGASVLGQANSPTFKVGQRNADAIREQFRQRGIPIAAEELGGNRGRTLELHPATGKAFIRLAASTAVEF